MIFSLFYNYWCQWQQHDFIYASDYTAQNIAVTDDTDLKGLEISNWNCIYQHLRACSSNHLIIQFKYDF